MEHPLNRSIEQHSGDDSEREGERAVELAEARFRNATKASEAGDGGHSLDALRSDLENTADLRYAVQSDLARSRTELADLTSQRATFKAGDETGDWNAREIIAMQARVQDLEAQERKLGTAVTEKAAMLERIRPGSEARNAELRMATSDLESARTKLGELRASATFRGERLEVLDPGIVPEKPSFPNTSLNLLVALAVSLPASILYLAVVFGYSRAVVARAEHVYSLQ